jgi:hypothetical protein
MIEMTDDDLERLNTLTDKALSETMKGDELREFNRLLTDWNESIELDLFSGHHFYQRAAKRPD